MVQEVNVKKKVVNYVAHKIPAGKGPRYWPEWIKLWWFRLGVETGIRELEPAEAVICCKDL